MPSPYELLFRRLGDRLDATLSPADARAIGETDLERLKHQGLIRALPLDAVACPVRTCELDCSLVPVPVPVQERGDGMFRLLCHRGRARDQVVHERDITAYECRADKALALLCTSNGATVFGAPGTRVTSGVVPVGNLPWAEDALLCLGVGIAPQRLDIELVAALRFNRRPVVVLTPSGRPLGLCDLHGLAARGVFPFDMDRVIDWDLLELDRVGVSVGMAARRLPVDPNGDARLVLHVPGCDAFYLGHRLDLSVLPFGFLLALAMSPGRTVSHDAASDVAYGVYNRGKEDPVDPDPGQSNRLKTHVMTAFRKLAEAGHLPAEDAEALILPNKGAGFFLTETSVRIDP